MAWGESARIEQELDPPKGPGGNPKGPDKRPTGASWLYFRRCLPDQATSLSQLTSDRTPYLGNSVALRHPRTRRLGAQLCQAERQHHAHRRRGAGAHDGLGSVCCSAGMQESNPADGHGCGDPESSCDDHSHLHAPAAAGSSRSSDCISHSRSRNHAVISSCSSSLLTSSCLLTARQLRVESRRQVPPSMQSRVKLNTACIPQGHRCREVNSTEGLSCSHQSNSGSCAAGALMQRDLQRKLEHTCFLHGRRLGQARVAQLASCTNMPRLHQLHVCSVQKYGRNVPVASRQGHKQLTPSMALW